MASNEGLGGTYFFSSEAGGRVGIMKPVDEEPLAPNNPKARCAGTQRWALGSGQTLNPAIVVVVADASA